MRAKGNGLKQGNALRAFTLIELLTVIAIISVLAAMLTGLSGVAASKMRTHRINGELAQLVTAIEGYKAELGFYPPDNQNQSITPTRRAQFNPLFFELTGATYEKGNFIALNQKDPVTPAALTKAFGVDGIGNSARNKGDVKYQTVRFRPSQYAHVTNLREPPVASTDNIFLLTVPVNGPEQLFMLNSVTPTGNPSGKVNVWQYDSSSTNRHNMATFDIWAVYNIGNRVITNGNWR